MAIGDDQIAILGPPWWWVGRTPDKFPREPVAGDGAKVTNGSPASSFRAASPGSGELRWMMSHAIGTTSNRHGLAVHYHNFRELVGAKMRVVACNPGDVEEAAPSGSSGGVNVTGDHTTISGQNPWTTSLASVVEPTTKTDDWELLFSFSNAVALQEEQMVAVRMRFKGTYDGADPTQEFTITLYDDAAVRSTRTVQARLANDQEWVVMMRAQASSWTSAANMANLKVKVAAQSQASGVAGNLYWQCRAVAWVKVKALSIDLSALPVSDYDSGWIDIGPTGYGHYNPRRIFATKIVPYLDNNNQVHLPLVVAEETWVWFTWEDGEDVPFQPFFSGADATIGSWLPEIGMIDEGVGRGFKILIKGFQWWFEDSSAVEVTAGDSDRVLRRRTRQRFSGVIAGIEESEMGEIHGWFHGIAATEMIAVITKPSEVVARQRQTVGRVTDFKDNYNTSTHPGTFTLQVREAL